MNSKGVVVLILLVAGVAASESALPQHGSVRFGVNIGIPLFGPGYYAPYAYPAPAYAYPAPPYAYPAPAYSYPAPAYSYPAPAMAPSGAFAQQGYATVVPVPAQPKGWYYCAGSNAYHPYVKECPGGWQRVPAQPQR